MQEIAPKRLTSTLWVRFLSQVNMLLCRTIFQYHPVTPVSFSAHIQRFSGSNESTVFIELTDGVFFQSREDVFNIV